MFFSVTGMMGSALLGMVTHRDVDFLNGDRLEMRVTEVSGIFPLQITSSFEMFSYPHG